MSSKKIKLTTSVNKINAKAKKKQSTKLKIILADPHKYLVPTLSTHNASELSDLIQSEIHRTGLSGKEFAKQFGITVGMASSLRAISGYNTACVLISKSIKPKFILQQIAYFTKQRNSKSPVFLVTNLEELCKTMFGVKSIVMTFGNSTSPKLADWITRQLPATDQKDTCVIKSHAPVGDTTKSSPTHKLDLNSILLRKDNNGERIFVPRKVINHEQQVIDNRIKVTSDYMGFSGNTCRPKQNIRVNAADGRTNIMNTFNTMPNRTQGPLVPSSNKNKKGRSRTNTSYDFPTSYIKLKTHTLVSNKQKSKKDK